MKTPTTGYPIGALLGLRAAREYIEQQQRKIRELEARLAAIEKALGRK